MILPDAEVASLKLALRCWEWFGYISTAVVGLGCIGEFIAEFTSLPTCEQRKHKIAKLSLMILILGIAGELLSAARTSQLSGQIIANIEERAADAGQKAGEADDRAEQLHKDAEKERLARVKIEQKLAPRGLSDEQRKRIKEMASEFPHQKLEVIQYGLSHEAIAFSKQIEDALHEGGWEVKETGILSGVEQEAGIFVIVSKEVQTLPAAYALSVLLKQEGFKPVKYVWDDGFRPNPIPKDVVVLFVGPKPWTN